MPDLKSTASLLWSIPYLTLLLITAGVVLLLVNATMPKSFKAVGYGRMLGGYVALVVASSLIVAVQLSYSDLIDAVLVLVPTTLLGTVVFIIPVVIFLEAIGLNCSVVLVSVEMVIVCAITFLVELQLGPSFEVLFSRWYRGLPDLLPPIAVALIAFSFGARISIFPRKNLTN